MNSTALIVFILAQVTVIGFTVYFFYLVLTSKKIELHDDHNPKTFDAT
ncbi:MAG: hypothetical protein IPN29_10210 [Saprospiraceae bacterium]|nr:hypothetical protein [Saprospiraceae bacterium]